MRFFVTLCCYDPLLFLLVGTERERGIYFNSWQYVRYMYYLRKIRMQHGKYCKRIKVQVEDEYQQLKINQVATYQFDCFGARFELLHDVNS